MSGCECVCVMSGWPRGAVNSELRCGCADGLRGHLLTHLPLRSAHCKGDWGVGGTGEMGETGGEREKGNEFGKLNGERKEA